MDLCDPSYWRHKGEEARTCAEGMQDPEACRVMLEIATVYNRMALRMRQADQPAVDGFNLDIQ